MTYKLFIDDERFPVSDDWIVARSSEEAINYVKAYGMPNEIAFDHDLGGEDTSRKFILALQDMLLDKEVVIHSSFKFSVHSQNPIGKSWIESTMKSLVGFFNEKT